MSCIFPDHPRQRSSGHFVNLERSATQIEENPCPLSDKCVVTAIASDLVILSDTTASDPDKVISCRLRIFLLTPDNWKVSEQPTARCVLA